MIDHKFVYYTRPFIRNQMIFYFISFIVPYFMVSFGNLANFPLKFCLSVALSGTSGMFFFEIMEMYVEGVRSYLKEWWNWVDCTSLVIFQTYASSKIYIDNSPDVDTTDLYEATNILEVFILLNIWLKISWFLKLQSDLGLMTQLISGVLKAVTPFLVIYLMWVMLFSLIAIILGSNKDLA